MNNVISTKLNVKGLKNAPGKDKFKAPKQSVIVGSTKGPVRKITVKKIK